MSIDTAVILAGGQGARLMPVSKGIPKPMVQIADKPLLAWILDWLENNGIKRVIIGVAYKKEKIMEYLMNRPNKELSIEFSNHSVEGGTAEGFRLAISRYVKDEQFFALNADQIADVNLIELANSHLRSRKKTLATMVVTKPMLPFGIVTIRKNRILSFTEKPKSPVYCSTGIYVFDRRILKYIPEKGDIEKVTLPHLANQGLIKAFIHNGTFITINTIKDLEEAQRRLKK